MKGVMNHGFSQGPLVVSLSNHAFRGNFSVIVARRSTQRAWFDRLTTNGILLATNSILLTTNGIVGAE